MSFSVQLESLCDSVLESNKSIQSVAIINNKGRPITKVSRPKFANQFPGHLSELYCMHHVLQISMGRDFDESYGPINYHMSERASLTTISFPLDGDVLLVTINKNTSQITLARKITDIINEHRKQSSLDSS